MYGARKDVTDLHVIINFQLFCDDVRTVKFLVNDAAADGVSVKTDKHVEKRGAVKDDELLVTVNCA